MAVTFVGQIIEGKLEETVDVGSEEKPKIEHKYKLEDILEDDYRFESPKPMTDQEKQAAALDALRAMANVSGGRVKVIKT